MVKRNCRIVDLSRRGGDHDGEAGTLQSSSDMRLTNMLLLSLSLSTSSSVRITDLLLPSILPSSTANHSREVTLDCPYTFTTEERHSLVVEWFVNNQTPRSTGEGRGWG